MFGLGMNEILIVGGILVVLFGGTKIAQLGKGLGEGIREFKSATGDAATISEVKEAPVAQSNASAA